MEGIVNRVHKIGNQLHKELAIFEEELLRMHGDLAGYFDFLGSRQAEYHAKMNLAYWQRKLVYHKEANIARKASDTSSWNQAESLAHGQIEAEIQEELEMVWRYETLKSICQAIQFYRENIVERIRNLRKEQEAMRTASLMDRILQNIRQIGRQG
ncbi:MAG: hypothetical protein A2600_13770 [Candidatus Lambdaproteobacteria bacterium RIFOXYD1_FULL_56_27]|uniref:Uncharacterized protein n=1 Tax=Candidatus Lambdaproteobacteria bacterium RIFOXYD2_FULL_56_26 TaxID=1817773 RepID=A0A1F6GLI3_9PROT|nr:MAG: hypothetical protein A2557_00590 [Candidatus Lambdaproteobacteria bacterium RIFOXYD2_FULL_56_26]OGH01558.1 MAG: hypothetical protein A2426_11330 [Candidatus Lambdaproteobacteria bacterium RIFOXYC1_FULL_56_13]OGH08822.1 MAG: hypothetical protein A2600_13770 [Candidatus Lambdaproteobacteria bacterium RIFOXYD1_FULL_56_27]